MANALEMGMTIETILEMLVDPETGVVLDEEQALELAEKWEGEKLAKVDCILKWVGEEKYKIACMEERNKDLEKRIKTKKNLVERLSKYAAITLNYQKYETPDGIAKISYRSNSDVVKVDDITMIPVEYFRTPRTEKELSKTMVKEAIKEGKSIPGAHLEDTKSIIIKG